MVTFNCEYCDKQFTRKSRLLAHVNIHTGIRPWQCGCGKSYIRKQYLIRHKDQCSYGSSKAIYDEISVKKLQKSYTCKNCNAGPFLKKRNLWAHRNIVHGEKKYQCSVCELQFPNLSKLVRHEKKHKTYYCELCEKTKREQDENFERHFFASFSELRKHKAVYHSFKNFVCDYCEKSFVRDQKLKSHLLHYHGKHEGDEGSHISRKHICDLCPNEPQNGLEPLSFKYKRNLSAHKSRVHGIKKRFQCTYENCKVFLSTQQKLNEHLRRHEKGIKVLGKNKCNQLEAKIAKLEKQLVPFQSGSDAEVSHSDKWETDSQSSIQALVNESHSGFKCI